ncbi:hypothetical protein SAY87_015964 [Trapa incisa]|uniref:HMA domain-containing protein n=1 Tax=Trapa incisa TaxID=236973 RepID=A0AAN7LBL5_9MYRT|nr:hypothetical protein SAY87_015964 [Trapa incisa]
MGVLHRFLDASPLKKKYRAMQTVRVKVKMDCAGCEKRVRDAVSSMKGARKVEVDRKKSLVIVSGYVESEDVLNEVKGTGKTTAVLWPYVEHNLVEYPYIAGAYDKKAPSGFVRDVPQAHANPNSPQHVLANFFNEEDPNACSIM